MSQKQASFATGVLAAFLLFGIGVVIAQRLGVPAAGAQARLTTRACGVGNWDCGTFCCPSGYPNCCAASQNYCCPSGYGNYCPTDGYCYSSPGSSPCGISGSVVCFGGSAGTATTTTTSRSTTSTSTSTSTSSTTSTTTTIPTTSTSTSTSTTTTSAPTTTTTSATTTTTSVPTTTTSTTSTSTTTTTIDPGTDAGGGSASIVFPGGVVAWDAGLFEVRGGPITQKFLGSGIDAQAQVQTEAGTGNQILDFANGTSIKLAPEPPPGGGAGTKIILDPGYTFVKKGRVRFTTRQRCFRNLSSRIDWSCKVHTGTTAVLVRGTDARDEATEVVFTVDNTAAAPRIEVEQGSVEVTPASGAITTVGAGQSSVVTNDSRNVSLFRYNLGSGGWAQLSYVAGGFSAVKGSWSGGWVVRAADFNADGLTDYLLYNESTGVWFKALNDGFGDFTYANGVWGARQRVYVVDLNGDGRSDAFTYDAASGGWTRATSTGDGTGGFSLVAGSWSSGWQIVPLDLDGNGLTDMFLYNAATGVWFRATNDGVSGFTYSTGTWSAGWQIHTGDFNADRRADVFLYDPRTGVWFICTNIGSDFSYSSGAWSPDWIVQTADLNADGRTDFFLYNRSTGRWFQMIVGAGGAIASYAGEWSPGWATFPNDLNRDGRADIVLYNRTTGAWFQAVNTAPGSFSYANGTWDRSLTLVMNPQFVQTDLY